MVVLLWVSITAGMFSVVMLYLAWRRRAHWEKEYLLAREPMGSCAIDAAFLARQARREHCLECEESWYKTYHWCLLLGPILFGVAGFCVVGYLLQESFWMVRFLPAFFAGTAVALMGWWLGYGPIRECFLPLENGRKPQR